LSLIGSFYLNCTLPTSYLLFPTTYPLPTYLLFLITYLHSYLHTSYAPIYYLCRNPSLGLATKTMACKVTGQEGSLGVKENVRECTLTLPKELPLWELESWLTPECLENDCKGQNLMDWKVLYIIGKLLKRRCLKWARMTHLDIWNTSYGQKKGRESNQQFNSRPLKVRNQPNFLACRWRETHFWKALNKSYNFVLNLISIGDLHTKL
jgi:hypothetical protein